MCFVDLFLARRVYIDVKGLASSKGKEEQSCVFAPGSIHFRPSDIQAASGIGNCKQNNSIITSRPVINVS